MVPSGILKWQTFVPKLKCPVCFTCSWARHFPNFLCANSLPGITQRLQNYLESLLTISTFIYSSHVAMHVISVISFSVNKEEIILVKGIERDLNVICKK